MTTNTEKGKVSYKDLHHLNKMSKKDVVPYYVSLIEDFKSDAFGDEVVRINTLIIRRWGSNALNDIKMMAYDQLL